MCVCLCVDLRSKWTNSAFPLQVCDSDTVLDPACTFEMLRVLEEDPQVGGVGGDVQVSCNQGSLGVGESRFFLLLVLFCLFWATPTAYRSPRLGVKWELQLPAYTTATPDPSPVCDLYTTAHGNAGTLTH